MQVDILREIPKPVQPRIDEVVLRLSAEEAAVLWRIGNSGGKVTEIIGGLIGRRYGNDPYQMSDTLASLYAKLRPLMVELGHAI